MRRSIPLTKAAADMPAVKPRKTGATKSALKTLDSWAEAAYVHEDDFLARFTRGGWTLVSISFTANSAKFVYILESGQHIMNDMTMEEWLKFFQEKSRQGVAPQRVAEVR